MHRWDRKVSEHINVSFVDNPFVSVLFLTMFTPLVLMPVQESTINSTFLYGHQNQ